MSAAGDDTAPLSDNAEQPLVKVASEDDSKDVTIDIAEENKKVGDDDDDDLDPDEIPQINIDKRASNFIQRRHSADFKNLDNKFEIKITGPSSIGIPEIDNKENDEKSDDVAYFQGSDDEEDALKMLGEPKHIVKTQSLDTGLV